MRKIINSYRKKPDTGGFTLVEVLVALMILLMVSQMLLLGVSFAAKVEKRTKQTERICNEIGEHQADRSECIEGTVRLKIDGICEDMEDRGWLYTGNNDPKSPVKLQIIWVEEGDFAGTGELLEEMPE